MFGALGCREVITSIRNSNTDADCGTSLENLMRVIHAVTQHERLFMESYVCPFRSSLPSSLRSGEDYLLKIGSLMQPHQILPSFSQSSLPLHHPQTRQRHVGAQLGSSALSSSSTGRRPLRSQSASLKRSYYHYLNPARTVGHARVPYGVWAPG